MKVKSSELFRKNLRKLVEDQGLRHSWVAEKAGISKSQLSNLLNGDGNISLDTFDKIVEGLSDFKHTNRPKYYFFMEEDEQALWEVLEMKKGETSAVNLFKAIAEGINPVVDTSPDNPKAQLQKLVDDFPPDQLEIAISALESVANSIRRSQAELKKKA